MPKVKLSKKRGYSDHFLSRMVGTYIGIDPGKAGGIVVLRDGDRPSTLSFGASTLKTIWDFLRPYGEVNPDREYVFAGIEKVGGYVAGNEFPGSAMFNFGKTVGHLEAFLIAAKIPHAFVSPAKWIRSAGVSPREKGEAKTKWKNRLKAAAESLFPSERITLAIADAALIADYVRRDRSIYVRAVNGDE